MNIALVSDWWKIKNKEPMPIWAYLCYLEFDGTVKSQEIFKEITNFINRVIDSDYKQKYIEFLKDSEYKWNVKDEDFTRIKVFSDECYIVCDAFKEFRNSNTI